jgi:hypothetical protein
MKVRRGIAIASILLSLIAARVAAAESPRPASSPAAAVTTSTATPAVAGADTTKVKAVKKRYLLSHSSSVYSHPDKTSTVIAHVHSKSHVNVTGVTGDWLRIRLSSGKDGFLPSSAAE